MANEIIDVAEESARGGFFLISGTALSTVVLAVSSIVIARFLGDAAYGQYTLALVVPQILFMFTDLGIIQGLTKFSAEALAKGEKDRIPNIVKHSLLLRALVGIILSVLCYVFADFFSAFVIQRPELSLYLRIASVSILFQVVFTTATSAFVGIDKTEYNALTTNVQAIAKTIIQITLILLGFTIAGAVIGHVMSYLVAGIFGILLIYILLRKIQTNDDVGFSQNVKTLMRYGTPLYVSSLLIGFIPLFKNVILAIYTTDADIGNYRAAINFGTLLTVLSVPIATAMLAAFSKLNSSNTQKLSKFFKFSNKYTAIIVIPVTFLMILFSNELVLTIYGSSFPSSHTFLAVYSLQYFLVALGYLTLASFYNGIGATKITMRISLITFLVLLILSPAMTSSYGVLGMQAAFLIATVLGQAYSSYYARKTFHIEFDSRSLIKIYGVAASSGILPLLISIFAHLPAFLNLAVGGILYVITYITLIPIIRAITIQELDQASSSIRKIRFLSIIAKPVLEYQRKILNKIKRSETPQK